MALPQREGRPSLDLKPDSTPDTASWAEHYGNKGANPLNNPVPDHKGDWPENGWMTVASDTVSEGEDFGPGSGGEQR